MICLCVGCFFGSGVEYVPSGPVHEHERVWCTRMLCHFPQAVLKLLMPEVAWLLIIAGFLNDMFTPVLCCLFVCSGMVLGVEVWAKRLENHAM